jgi:starvation-inducible DNA-binding protein
MTDSVLIDKMKEYLASNFAFYLKLHFFHWNVEGSNFIQYHELFKDLFTDVHGAVDDIAEHLRALHAYAPGSFSRFSELSLIEDQIEPCSARDMLNKALLDNMKMLSIISYLDKMASATNEIGLSNFLQSRYEIHNKHQWMLRAILKDV